MNWIISGTCKIPNAPFPMDCHIYTYPCVLPYVTLHSPSLIFQYSILFAQCVHAKCGRYASQWNKVHVTLHAGMHWPSLGNCVSALPTCECAPGDRRWDLSDIWRSWCQGHCMEAWQVCIVMDTVLSMMRQCVQSPQWRCGCVNSLHTVNRIWAHMVFWLILRALLEWCWVMFSLLTVEYDSFQVRRPHPYLKMWRWLIPWASKNFSCLLCRSTCSEGIISPRWPQCLTAVLTSDISSLA